MAKSKDGVDLEAGDCVTFTCPDTGKQVNGVVICDDGNKVKIAYPHMHVGCFDACCVTKDA